MSSIAAHPLVERARSVRPGIQIVATRAQRKARPRAFYPLMAMFVVFGIIIAQVLLSVAVSSGAYEIAALQQSNKELGRTYQTTNQDIDRLSSPQNLAANAAALGMVNNATPVYLRLSDGAVLGSPIPAKASAGAAASSLRVPNALLNGVPLVTQLEAEANAVAAQKAAAEAAAAQASAATVAGIGPASAPASAVANGPIALTNGIPSVSTR
jgi:outer membrane murein-binding lipoprotein Lpp